MTLRNTVFFFLLSSRLLKVDTERDLKERNNKMENIEKYDSPVNLGYSVVVQIDHVQFLDVFKRMLLQYDDHVSA